MASRRSLIAAKNGVEMRKETPGGIWQGRRFRYGVGRYLCLGQQSLLTVKSHFDRQPRHHERILLHALLATSESRREMASSCHCSRLLGIVVAVGVALSGGGDSSVEQMELADSAFVVDTDVNVPAVPNLVSDAIGAVETSLPSAKLCCSEISAKAWLAMT